jgi:phosphatidylglycerophosphate synthase
MFIWLPNAITLSRLLLGVAFPWLPLAWRFPVVVIAAITDGLDGQASRFLRAESKLGVMLDPLADKVFFLAVVATLLWDGSVTWLEVFLISLRDIAVLAGALGAWLRDGGAAWSRMKPRWLGKLATVLQFLFIGAVLLEAADWRGPILIATAMVSGLAGLDYVWVYLSLHKRRER